MPSMTIDHVYSKSKFVQLLWILTLILILALEFERFKCRFWLDFWLNTNTTFNWLGKT